MHVALLPNVQDYGVVSMERYADDLTQALQACSPATDVIQRLRISGPGALPLRWRLRYARFVRYPRAIRNCSTDLYHVLDHSHAHLLDLLPPARSLLTFHDCIPHLAMLGRLPLTVSPAERRASPRRLQQAGKAARIIVDSQATRDNLIELGGLDSGRIDVLPLAVNPQFHPGEPGLREHDRSQLRRQLGLDPAALILLHVGSVAGYKNLPALIEVFHRLAQHDDLRRRLHVLRVGPSMAPTDAALAARLGVLPRMHRLAGAADDAALACIYRGADLLLFPSWWEGFGWPPLEAMACATPALCSNGGALAELMEGVGQTAAPDDHDRMASLALKLLRDPVSRADQVARGLQRAAQRRWPDYAERLRAIYHRVLG